MKRKKLQLVKRKKLQLLRISHNLTQQAMADKLGVKRETYIKIEHGERNPRPEFWDSLQKAFNIPDAEMWAYQKGGEVVEE